MCFEASAARLRASVAWLDTIQTESHCSPPILYSRIAPFVMAGGAEILFYGKNRKIYKSRGRTFKFPGGKKGRKEKERKEKKERRRKKRKEEKEEKKKKDQQKKERCASLYLASFLYSSAASSKHTVDLLLLP